MTRVALAVVAGMLVFGVGQAGAAVSQGGFTVSPAFAEVDVPAAQPQVTHDIELTNQNASSQLFNLSVLDFGSLDENGGVAFLGAPANELSRRYGLAAWLRLPETSVTVPAGGSVDVPLVVANQATLAPGGHYGAVLATAMTAGGGGNSVGLKQVLSSLILVTKEGGVQRNLKLASQSVNAGWWHLPGMVKQRFYAGGNVHVVPRGVVSVRDPGGHEVERAAINEDSEWVLPETYRRFSTDFLADGRAWLPGLYTVVTSYRYDGTNKLTKSVSHFWYVGTLVVWLVVVLALAAAGVLAWWLWSRKTT